MKTRFYMLNLLAGIALATFSLMSCGKGAFLDTDDPVTRGILEPIPDTLKPIEPLDPPLEFNPIYCENSNGQTVESPLFVGTPYTFKVNIGFHIDDIPTIEFAIRNSSGKLVLRPVESNSTSKQYTFTTPDVYTVIVTVTNKLGTKTYDRTYKVIGEGIDTSNPKLNVPFSLYLNPSGTDEVVLNVSETLFNDPQCTVSQPERGHFVICIKQPGKYEFRVRYPNRPLQPFGYYRANVFYRPNLVCFCEMIGKSKFANKLNLKTNSDLQIPWFNERLAFSCYTTGRPELAKDYTAAKYDNYVDIGNTSKPSTSNVNIREYSIQEPPSGFYNTWTVVYPRDTCYYFSGHIEI